MELPVNQMQESGDEEDVVPKRINNYKRLLDSDSEEEPNIEKVKNINESLNKSSNGPSQSSSDSEQDVSMTKDEEDVVPKRINNYKRLLDSDSEEEPNIEKVKNIDESLNKSSNGPSQSSSDSEQDVSMTKEPIKDRRKNSNPKKKILPVKTQRKSAAKCMDTIKTKMSHKQEAELKQKIQSEKQRMEREQEIRVPYHKPKQYSLKEFLSRKSINMPSVEIEKIKKGERPVDSIIALKMRGEELEKFAQKMKAREEEALEFFRSESESEDEDNADSKPIETEEKVATSDKAISNEDPNESKENAETNDLAISNEVPKDNEEHVETNDVASSREEPTEQVKESEVFEPEEASMSDENNVPEEIEVNVANKDQELDRLREKYKNEPIEFGNLKEKENQFSTLKTLQGMSKDDVIDLESGLVQPRQLSGPEKLFQRYLKTVQKPKVKDTISMNILTVENGKLENRKVEVKLDKEMEFDHNRPGFSREQMKNSLRSQIAAKRREEFEKHLKQKIETVEFEPEDKESCDEDEVLDVGEVDPEYEDADEETEVEAYDVLDALKNKKHDASEEESGSDASEEESESDESDDEPSDEEVETNPIKKGRILKAFVDSDDEESKETSSRKEEITEAPQLESEVFPCMTEDIVDAQTDSHNLSASQNDVSFRESDTFNESDFTFTEPSISEKMITTDIKDLCDEGPSQVMDEDFLDILSGRFAETQENQSESEPTANEDIVESQFISQVPETDVVEEKVASPVKKQRKILDSSEDEENPQNDIKRRKKSKKKRKSKVQKLQYSDDEESIPNDEELESMEECEEEEEAEEPEEVMVDYDSEENEIEVKMKKKDLIQAANKYFEQEAELSESEWGSADEDEKDLDKYDIELADEEDFDQNKLQEEVGRIHARKVLDDDIRNVKQIEDFLFENEENDGVGRVRQFRWANQKSFTMEDENAQDGNVLEESDGEEESEIMWRKMRHERETMLSEQSQKMDSDTLTDEIVFLDPNSQSVTTSNMSLMAKKKFKIIKSTSAMESLLNSSDVASKTKSTFLIKSSSVSKFQNSSFLSRDEQTLTRIAKFISHKDDEVTNLSHGSNSMSFLTIDKPDESKKRKSEGSKMQEPSKKQKLEVNPKQMLLDRLK